MRDIDRIDRVCDKFKELWKFFPDQRFGQLFFNFVVKRSNDYFYQEDVVSEKNIDEQIDLIKNLILEKDKEILDMKNDFAIEFINGKSSKF